MDWFWIALYGGRGIFYLQLCQRYIRQTSRYKKIKTLTILKFKVMAETEKGSNIYWKVAAGIFTGIGIMLLYNKFVEGKRNANTMNTLTAKAQLEQIVKDGEKHEKKPEVPLDPNTQSIQSEDKVITGEMRGNAFSGQKEDVAEPTNIEIEKKQAPVKNAGSMNASGDAALPMNAFIGSVSNASGFDEGDVIYSLGNQDSRIARMVSGNFTFLDKSGNGMGVFKSNHRQKLGVIAAKGDNGVYFKAAPDWKRYGFIGYEKMYKLT